MTKKNNQQKNWLLSLVKHGYITLGVGILLFCGVGGAVDSNRALAKDDLPKIAQSSTTNKEKADSIVAEGMELYRQGTADSLRQAIKKWEEALSLYQMVGDRGGEATTLNNIGAVYRALGEKQKALNFYNQALPLYRAVGDRGGEAVTLNNIGLVYSDLGEKQKALEFFNQALPIRRAVGDRGGEATTLTNIGAVYDALGEKQKALNFYNQALPIFRAVGDYSGEAATLNNIGGVYNALGEKQKALEFFNQVLPLSRTVGNRGGEATTLNNIGNVYNALGEKQKALEFYNQALPLSSAVGDRGVEATTLNNIGNVYDALGEKQKALEFYNQALPLSSAVGDRDGEAGTLHNIGSVYSALGEKQKALEFFNQALPIRRAVGDRGGEATTLHNIGSVYSALGEKQKALEFYNQALPLSSAVGDRDGEAGTLNNIGAVYDDLGAKQKALDFYNQALPLRRAVGDRGGEAGTLNNIGLVHDALGEKQKALEFFNQALPLLRVVGDLSGQAVTLNNIGFVYRDTKRPMEAIKNFEQSAHLILKLRSGVGKDNRQTFLENEQGKAVVLIDLLIDQKQPERAFEWANLATVADLADYSRLVNAKVTNPEAQTAIDKWNQKNLRLESLRKDLQQKFSSQLSQQVNKLQEELYQEAETIRKRFPEVADLFETKPTDITQLRANIPTGTTVIQPVILSNNIALFVLTKDNLKVIKVPLPAQLDDSLTKTYNAITKSDSIDFLDRLQPLYDLLIRPIEAEIQATKPKQISIIATGKLRYIPFEALHDGNEYLIEKYPINYLTRLSSRSLQAKTTATPVSAKKILAFGNPIPKPPLALNGAEAEVKSIISIFPGSEAFINNQATLNTFKTQIPRFSILHLATHGCFQKGGCPKLGLEENVLLFADKRFNIQDAALLGLQNVELITLSACQTALQTESNGEEISGVAYLFERAGSKAVIASLWSAADEDTRKIMEQFYQNIKKGMRKDEALRQAKLSQIDSPPFYWSPFVLIGDGR
jgi:CHAT domain-containing protein/Tfp pilus assembly protein PilF